MDLFALLNILLILHLAGLIMGFIGGRTHGVIVSRIADTNGETQELYWGFEEKASKMAFIGTTLLIVSGLAMLWLKYGGIDGQELLFWIKMALVVVVATAEIMRHRTARKWKAGDAAGQQQTRMWGRISGLAAVATVVVAVFNFN